MRRIMLIVLGVFLFAGISFAGLQVNPVTGKLDKTGGANAAGWTSDLSTKTTTTYNVGVGTINPTEALEVVGNLVVSGSITALGSENMGIGTILPSQKLDVIGTVKSTGLMVGAAITVVNGNVGIGSTVPGQMLDVQGTLRIAGSDGITNNWGDSLDFFGCNDNVLCFRVNANPSTSDSGFGVEYLDNTQISMTHDGTNMVIDSTVGGVSTSDFFRAAMQTVTVADNGGGTAATGTVTPTSNNIRLQCNDANGCTMSMSETGAQTGIEVTIVNNTSNTATFADSAGVLETIAGASCALGLNDVMNIFYQNSTWLVMSCVDH